MGGWFTEWSDIFNRFGRYNKASVTRAVTLTVTRAVTLAVTFFNPTATLQQQQQQHRRPMSGQGQAGQAEQVSDSDNLNLS